MLKVEMGDLVKVEDTKEQREELKSRERKLEEDLLLEKAKNSVLKDRLLDKENELQCISQENDDLKFREVAALSRVHAFTLQLAAAKWKKSLDFSAGEVNEEYDILPKAADIPDDGAANLTMEEPSAPTPPPAPQQEDETNAWDNCHVDKESSHPQAEVTNEGSDAIVKGNVTTCGPLPNKFLLDSMKKKPLLRKFGNLLKKKGNPK